MGKTELNWWTGAGFEPPTSQGQPIVHAGQIGLFDYSLDIAESVKVFVKRVDCLNCLFFH